MLTEALITRMVRGWIVDGGAAARNNGADHCGMIKEAQKVTAQGDDAPASVGLWPVAGCGLPSGCRPGPVYYSRKFNLFDWSACRRCSPY